MYPCIFRLNFACDFLLQEVAAFQEEGFFSFLGVCVWFFWFIFCLILAAIVEFYERLIHRPDVLHSKNVQKSLCGDKVHFSTVIPPKKEINSSGVNHRRCSKSSFVSV